jgi:hypothetical protein
MQLNKSALAVVITAIALWGESATGAPAGYNFRTLNFSLTAAQQVRESTGTASNTYVFTTRTCRITSKTLLSFLATAFDTNWPAGAQLALDPFQSELFVVDRTGTNPVCNVSSGINVGGTNVAYFSFEADMPVSVDDIVGFEKHDELRDFRRDTEFRKVYYHLFNEQNGATNTDLAFDGLSVVDACLTTAGATNPATVIGSACEQETVAGDGTFNLNWTVVSGRVTTWWRLYPPGPLPIMPNPFPTNSPPPIILNPRTSHRR